MNALFSIGQKVVCVDSVGAPELIEGKSYVITGFDYCDNCKQTGVFIGVKGENPPYPICSCGVKVPKKVETSFRQTRFVPLDFDRKADEEIHEALKGVKIEN